jgi:hypothetical protein
MAIVPVIVVGAVSFILNRTAYGRTLSAVGQNAIAARLAGVRTIHVAAGAFLASSILAAFTGLLLGAYVGGAFLNMGQPFLLRSLGAVVLGGTLIFGGSPTAIGTLFGAVPLVLIVTTMQITRLPPGTQDVVEGLVIVAVLALAGGTTLRRRARRPVAVAAKQRRGLPHRYSARASFAPLVTAYLGKSTVPGERAPLEAQDGIAMDHAAVDLRHLSREFGRSADGPRRLRQVKASSRARMYHFSWH